jgi:hypothetical protein
LYAHQRRMAIFLGTLISLLVLSLTGMAISANASSSTGSWSTSFSFSFGDPQGLSFYGLPPGTNFGGQGSCNFVGTSSGASGSCQGANEIHIPGSSSTTTCQTFIEIMGWDEELNLYGSGTIDFFITAGQVTVVPSSLTAMCLGVFFPPGTVDLSTGNFIAPYDTTFVASPGHFSLMIHFLVPFQFNEQVQFQTTFINS